MHFETRFWWFLALAVLLHGVAVLYYGSPNVEPNKPHKPENRVRVSLKSFEPSLPASRLASPQPVQKIPKPLTPQQSRIKPIETTKAVPRVKQKKPTRKVVHVKPAPRMQTAMLDAPAVKAPPVEAPAVSFPAAPAAQAAVPSKAIGTSPMPPRSEPGEAEGFEDYFGAVRSLIEEKKRYPLMSRRTRQEGKARVRFVILKGGRLEGQPSIQESSGHATLDRAAVRSIKDAAPFPPIPENMGKDRLELSLVISFQLKE